MLAHRPRAVDPLREPPNPPGDGRLKPPLCPPKLDLDPPQPERPMLLPLEGLDGAALERPTVPLRLALERVQPRPREALGVPEPRTDPVRVGLVRGWLMMGALGVVLGAVLVSVGPVA